MALLGGPSTSPLAATLGVRPHVHLLARHIPPRGNCRCFGVRLTTGGNASVARETTFQGRSSKHMRSQLDRCCAVPSPSTTVVAAGCSFACPLFYLFVRIRVWRVAGCAGARLALRWFRAWQLTIVGGDRERLVVTAAAAGAGRPCAPASSVRRGRLAPDIR